MIVFSATSVLGHEACGAIEGAYDHLKLGGIDAIECFESLYLPKDGSLSLTENGSKTPGEQGIRKGPVANLDTRRLLSSP